MKDPHRDSTDLAVAEVPSAGADTGVTGMDPTLALLGREQPRPGLEGRMLAQLRYAPLRRSWVFLLPSPSPRLMVPVLCFTAVAFFATAGFEYRNGHREPSFVPAHLPAQMATRGVTASAAVAVAQAPIHPGTRGRGRRLRAGRGQHARVLLPPGTTAPTQRNLRIANAQQD